MSISIILEIQKFNILKNTRRILEKFFMLHKQNKLENIPEKIDKLKSLIERNTSTLIQLDEQINKRKLYDKCIFYIIEYLNVQKCFKTSEMLSKKYNMESDIDFYKMVYNFVDEMKNNKFENTLLFIKENKLLFRNYNIKKQLEIRYFMHLCIIKKYKEAVEFIRNSEIEKKYLINLIKTRKYSDKDFISDEQVLDTILDAFGVSTRRLQKRIEYGMISYKTKICYRNPVEDCPCCRFIRLRKEIPFNKKEHSIILCSGSGDLINESNCGYVFENGKVYGKKYINANKNIEEGYVYPKICYFL